MDQQDSSDETINEPFKVSDAERPDLVVEPQKSSTSISVAAPITSAQVASASASASASAAAAAKPKLPLWTKTKASHVDLSDTIDKPKTPWTRKRLVLFIFGFCLAVIAGNITNWFMCDFLENSTSPDYIKEFNAAEAFLKSDQKKAFAGMEHALKDGEVFEPNSHRFSLLTANLAKHFDEAGRYLEAKSRWARAAAPTFSSSPTFRKLKRSYLLSEARSEHFAYAAKMKNDVDMVLLIQLEHPEMLFCFDGSAEFRVQVMDSYELAASLSADANDFNRAERDLNLEAGASSIADPINAAFITNGTEGEARWLIHLQRNVHELLLSKAKPFPRSRYSPSSSRAANAVLDSALKAQQWDKVEKLFADAQNEHSQDVYGSTILTDLYSTDHDWGENTVGQGYEQQLDQWRRKHLSLRACMATAMAFERLASRAASEGRFGNAFNEIDISDSNLLQVLQEAPEMAYEPSIIDCLQNNFYAYEKYIKWSLPTNRLIGDLRAASIKMSGDDTRVSINELIADTERKPLTKQTFNAMVQRATEKANEFGGEAGDKFYTRALWTIGPKRSAGLFDDKRFARGTSLLKREFGYTIDEIL